MSEAEAASAAPLLVRLLRGEAVERAPVWAMRQAGRWDPEFRRLRAGLSFYEFSEDVERSAEASIYPLRFGVDAVILFYDITTLAVAMGQRFDLVPSRGPTPQRPIRTLSDVERLSSDPDPDDYRHVLEILRIVRSEVGRSAAVLIFAGAPFTMAAYQTAIGKRIGDLRAFAAENPEVWTRLLERTTDATIGFLNTLKAEGADAYQLFDSWAGELTEEEYRLHAHAHHRRIFEAAGGPSILFVKDSPYVELACEARCTGVSLGVRHDLSSWIARRPDLVWQGNVDHELLVHGDPDSVRAATLRCLEEGKGGRHVLNLDHGMDPRAKPENFAAFVEAARTAAR